MYCNDMSHGICIYIALIVRPCTITSCILVDWQRKRTLNIIFTMKILDFNPNCILVDWQRKRTLNMILTMKILDFNPRPLCTIVQCT